MLCASSIVLAAVVLLVVVGRVVEAVAPANSIPVKVINHAGAPIEVYWINTFSNDGTIVKQTQKPLRNSSEAAINSYDGHQFVAKFLQEIDGAEAYFTKGPSEESVIIEYNAESNTMSARQITKFDEIMDQIREAETFCGELAGTAFTDCIKSKVIEETTRLTDTTNEIKRYRDLMSPKIRDYVCSDPKANVSEALRTIPFDDRKERYNVDIMVETDRAKVWVVKNAISAKECALLAKESQPSASGAAQSAVSVSASVDGSMMVEADQLDSAAPHFTYALSAQSPEKDALWPLYSKIIKVTNVVTKLSLPVLAQQEAFGLSHFPVGGSIGTHYHGQTKYESGNRVASALLFCEVAKSGGHVTFPKADLVLRPETGTGVFFSYTSASGALDDGYTEASGCPVREGGVSVATLHLRSGKPALAGTSVTEVGSP